MISWLFRIPLAIFIILILLSTQQNLASNILYSAGLLLVLAPLCIQILKDQNKRVYSVPIFHNNLSKVFSKLKENGFEETTQLDAKTVTYTHPALKGYLEVETTKFSYVRLYKTIAYSADNEPLNKLCNGFKVIF